MNTDVKPGYKQTEVGIIPEDWECGELSQFWNVTDCKHVTAEFISNGYPVASIREVQSRFVDLSAANQTTQRFFALLCDGGRKPRPGDILLSRNATVGEVAQVAEWHPPFAMGQDVCLMRKKVEDLSTDYLQSVFRSRIIVTQLADFMVGSTFKRVNVEQVKNLIVPMPPKAEQEAIAGALGDADALIESLEQLVAKKRQIKHGAMQELLTGQRRLPGFSGEWESTTLGELTTFLSGGTPSRSNEDYWTGDIPWISATSLRCFEICRSDSNVTRDAVVAGSKMAPVGSSLMLVRGSALHNEILCGLVTHPVCFNQDVKALVPGPQLVPRFLTLFIKGSAEAFLKLVSSAGNTAGVLDTKLLKAFAIKLPNHEEQSAIAAVLTDMDAEITALESKLAKARQVKQGMMQVLLTGRIRLVESLLEEQQ